MSIFFVIGCLSCSLFIIFGYYDIKKKLDFICDYIKKLEDEKNEKN